MIKYLVAVTMGVFLLTACEVNQTEVASTQNTDENLQVEHGEEIDVIPTHIATLEVEGMMCQKGCGSILRKGLYETGGVAQVDVTFEDDEPVNEITIYFDKGKIAVEDMIVVIGELANQQYTAKLKSVSESSLSS